MRTRLWLLLALACASCMQDHAGTPTPAAPAKWTVRNTDGITTVRNNRTGSCYVGLQRTVYGGTSVTLTTAASLGDCE